MTLERVEYQDGGTALTGWLARPAGDPLAAVLVFPTIANVTLATERLLVLNGLPAGTTALPPGRKLKLVVWGTPARLPAPR